MKMVHGNTVFIREELARNTHQYTFSMRNFTSFNSVNFPEHKKQTTLLAARNHLLTWLWRDARGHYSQKLVPTRSWKLCIFSTISPMFKEVCSTMKGPKSSFWVSSYLNQLLIISNLQNQSVTDRQTDRRNNYYNPPAHARCITLEKAYLKVTKF